MQNSGKITTIVVLVIVALFIVFALQNIEVTEVKIFFWKISISRILIILGSFVAGLLVGLLFSAKKQFSRKTNQ
ncbi:MAG: lipopolysaccharide assembly protein LapA domain-containing protein [Altibacter sp.]|uniref:lipopolysaccharide assembly protein LapA domain-containing protein n=1 Tax=Altibacter sp. TaxID=2024823 RepID=UPI001DF6BD3B|nr:lipopolysaccharide assembly protein LapA domain-containing protein [Altibacter sp.]MBZ0326777.1 lipopolysaccharide assembly protein LapA domain-containing protein [Altibacter sp.]